MIAITEGIPAHDMLRDLLEGAGGRRAADRPELPRRALARARRTSGSSRPSSSSRARSASSRKSGTLTYQIGNELKQAGLGNSTIVGIGGDPIVGSDFIDILELFEDDHETELIVMVGEIGGDAEERAADFIAEHVTQAGRRLHRRASPRRPASRWATPARSSPAPRAPPRRRRRRSRPRASGSGESPTEAAQLAAETIGAKA